MFKTLASLTYPNLTYLEIMNTVDCPAYLLGYGRTAAETGLFSRQGQIIIILHIVQSSICLHSFHIHWGVKRSEREPDHKSVLNYALTEKSCSLFWDIVSQSFSALLPTFGTTCASHLPASRT